MKRAALLATLFFSAALLTGQTPRPATTIPASKVRVTGLPSTDLQSAIDNDEIGGGGVGGSVASVGNCAGGACFGGVTGNTITSTTGEVLNLATDGVLLFQRNTAGAITVLGADNASPADTIFDTTGAGSITVGSPDVLAITLSTDNTGDGTDVVLPTGAVGSTEILDNTILEADLSAGAPTDELCLTFELSTGGFEWQSCGGGSADIGSLADGGNLCSANQTVVRNGADTAFICTTPAGGGDALVANPLSQFAATTSAQLDGVISDDTGTGALVFADTPTLVTPVLGAATGTSVVLSGSATAASLIASAAAPTLDVIDTDFAGDGVRLITSVPTNNDVFWQLSANSGATTHVGMVTVNTVDAGASTLYFGVATEGSLPTNSVQISEDGTLTFHAATDPVTAAAGETAFDTNHLGTKGAIEVHSGGESTFVVATANAPTDNQIPVFDDATDTVNWETGGGGGLTSGDIDSCTDIATIMADETGTCGALVLSNSPTLVTPEIGAATGTSLMLSAASPTLTITDTDFATDGLRISVGVPTNNDVFWQIGANSGTNGTYPGMVTVNTTDPGVSTLYFGIASEGSLPTSAVQVSEGGILTFLAGTAPTTAAAGETAFDTDALGTLGAIETYDGGASTFVVATRDAPTDNQVPVFDDATDTVNWETPAVGGSGSPACIALSAAEITCLSSSGCSGETINGTAFSYLTANFNTSANSTGTFNFNVPVGFDGHTASVRIDWTSNNAACNADATNDDVCFVFDSGSIVDNAAFNAPTLSGTANNVTDVCDTNGDVMSVTRTGYVHGFSDSTRGIFSLTRDVDETLTGTCANNADTYVEDAKIVGVTICPE